MSTKDNTEENKIKKLTIAKHAVEAEIQRARLSPYRPLNHFHSPAQWMNDPNGCIFFEGKYHIFYQHNPFGDKWGHMHWGHAISDDLIHWEHLPISLPPSLEKGENHCFSGTIVFHPSIQQPMLFYTSIGKTTDVIKGASQWRAFPQTIDLENLETLYDPEQHSTSLDFWVKDTNNPVLKESLHEQLGFSLHHWRDPFVWYYEGLWWMVVGGKLIREQGKKQKIGMVMLYKSTDLEQWVCMGLLFAGGATKVNASGDHNKYQQKPWECPNFVSLTKLDQNDHRWMLVISPCSKTRYCLGLLQYPEKPSFSRSLPFQGEEWYTLDHGDRFYAPQFFNNVEDRIIFIGWIKGGDPETQGLKSYLLQAGLGKAGGWNGNFSFPREIKKQNDQIEFHPIVETECLRSREIPIDTAPWDREHELSINIPIEKPVEIRCVITSTTDISKDPSLGLFISPLLKNKRFQNEQWNLSMIPSKKILKVGRENMLLERVFNSPIHEFVFHVFLDRSVIEVFLNYQEVYTDRVYFPPNQKEWILTFFSTNFNHQIREIKVWEQKV